MAGQPAGFGRDFGLEAVAAGRQRLVWSADFVAAAAGQHKAGGLLVLARILDWRQLLLGKGLGGLNWRLLGGLLPWMLGIGRHISTWWPSCQTDCASSSRATNLPTGKCGLKLELFVVGNLLI
jgi:hypothetical protein